MSNGTVFKGRHQDRDGTITERLAHRDMNTSVEMFTHKKREGVDTGNLRMRIVLDELTCRDTEDMGVDEVYVTGGVIAGIKANRFVTQPHSMCSGQTMLWAGTDRVLFEGDLPKSGDILLELTLWESDKPAAWERKESILNRQAIRDVFNTISKAAAPAIAVQYSGTAVGDAMLGSSSASRFVGEEEKRQNELENWHQKEKGAQLSKFAKEDLRQKLQAQEEARALFEAQAKARVLAEAEAEAQARVQAQADALAKAEGAANAKAQADALTKAKDLAKAKAESLAKAEADVRAKTEALALAEALVQAQDERQGQGVTPPAQFKVSGALVDNGLDAAKASLASIAFGKDGIGALVTLAETIVKAAIQADKDDQLGTLLERIDVDTVREEQDLTKHGGVLLFKKTFKSSSKVPGKTWDYDLKYSIHVEPQGRIDEDRITLEPQPVVQKVRK